MTIDPPLEVPPAEVIDGRVFLGNKSHANNYSTVQRLGITHVLNVSRDNTAPWAAHGITYCHCYVADSVQSDISRYFEQVCLRVQVLRLMGSQGLGCMWSIQPPASQLCRSRFRLANLRRPRSVPRHIRRILNPEGLTPLFPAAGVNVYGANKP